MSSSNTVPAYRVLAQGRQYHLGVMSALVTACIWASWLISVKMGATSSLTMFDLSMMRYGMPALIFAYFTYQARAQIRKVPLHILGGISLGAGVPFFYLASQGMHFAPVSHAGLLIPGTFPLFVTGIAVLIYKEPLSSQRFMGLAAIAIGILTLLAESFFAGSGQVLTGDLYFLGASFCWALFTVSLRVSGLPPLAATGLLGLVSCSLLLLLFAFGLLDSGVFGANQTLDMSLIGTQFLIQGIMVGLVTGFSYGFAIRQIGAENTAAIGSLTPVIASVAAYPILAETLSINGVLSMSLICFGVLCASGVKLNKIWFFKK
ncbi:DMT family transporter [Marinomonas sp. S3726]|jgi:drug/metabolite transporter (DMT)-like permease|uniref:DMT family transporter n=1 Tax=Marinomonas sp. S3726 TaxID=579484 RepID=UPI0005F9D9E9|nr:DMT family transporter [Marinomonas sp. S3726]